MRQCKRILLVVHMSWISPHEIGFCIDVYKHTAMASPNESSRHASFIPPASLRRVLVTWLHDGETSSCIVYLVKDKFIGGILLRVLRCCFARKWASKSCHASYSRGGCANAVELMVRRVQHKIISEMLRQWLFSCVEMGCHFLNWSVKSFWNLVWTCQNMKQIYARYHVCT